MALVTKRELLQLKQFHYIVELILAFSYILLKAIPYASILDDQLFGTFEFKSVSCQLNNGPEPISSLMSNHFRNIHHSFYSLTQPDAAVGRIRVAHIHSNLDRL